MLNHIDLMAALTADFLNVYVMRPEEDSADVIKLQGYVTQGMTEDLQNFSYSKLLRTYAESRVYSEDREYFLRVLSCESIIKTFQDGRDRLDCDYRVEENGQIHYYSARYSRISKPDEDLRLVVAFKNIDSIINVGVEQQKRGLYNAYNAISGIFFSMHRVNVKDNTYASIKTTPSIDKVTIAGSDNYDDNSKRIITALSSNWSVEDALRFVDRSTLKERMAGKNHIMMDFLSYAAESCRLHFLVEDKDENGELYHVIFAVEKVDEEKSQAIINVLSRDYQNVFWINLEDGSARILKMNKPISDDMNESENRRFKYGEICEDYIANSVYPDDRKKLEDTISLENLREIFRDKDEISGSYRAYTDGQLHHYRYSYFKLANLNSVVTGFRNIDDLIAQHEAEEKARREAELAHQKEMEEHIKLREARLREAQEHTEVISALSTIYSTIFRADVDTHDYEILTSVPLMGTVARTTGNFDDVKEQIISAFMAPECQAPMREFLDLDTLADRLEKINTVTTEYKDSQGQWFKSRFIVKRRDENGVVKEILYVCRNNTDEKIKEIEQQNQLAHALMAAQQANKAKSTFLNSMSHDIRTPMNAIIGFTALAQTHMDDPSQVQDYLAKISTSSTHLLSLINDVLDMSRIESGTVKLDERPIHIPDLLHDLRTMIQGLTNSKNQNLYIDTQDVLHEDVIADRLRLNQVLINIIGNAVKYTQPGGDIIIRLLEKPSAKQHYRTYEFSVKDTGIGMTKEFKEHIFESFSRERNSTTSGIQGTGLGMAITKNIVDLMGGEITVESEEGKGSTFTVVLDMKLAAEPVLRDPIPALKGARVLVADDDLNTCKSVSQMLRDIEMRPDWTASGREAVIRAQEAAEIKDEYKVYIIDYLMPDMNGVETVRRIRRVISEDVPIIVLTAYDWSDFEAEAREAGVTAFVSKPLFMSELRSVLANPSGKGDNKDKKTKNYDYSGKHVLLVEDNELNREIATAILEDVNMKVDTAVDGAEAVEIMHKADENEYDLIFMDIQMPKMDGYTATREIRTLTNNRKANIPIVAMTANAFEEDKIKSLEAGMNAHISKPISMEAIADVLDPIFAGRA